MTTLSDMNDVISMLRRILNNLRQQIKTDDHKKLMARLQALKKDEIIAAQYESMALMKKINQEEDYLKEAKEVALRILQNTLYQMVDKIQSCKTEVIFNKLFYSRHYIQRFCIRKRDSLKFFVLQDLQL